MAAFPEQLPHGTLKEVFPDVFYLKGQISIPTPDTTVRLTRSMVVVRSGHNLTLINTIRLAENELQSLDRLGRVKDIIRIGGNHGRDDAFFSDRYEAPVWTPQGIETARPVKHTATLSAGDLGPLDDATVLLFETTKTPEAVICLHRHGGILVTADSFHNMPAPDAFVDPASATLLDAAGFFRAANIGPVWRKREQPARDDYDRLLTLPFIHLLPGHGDPILDTAKEDLRQSVEDLF